MLQEQKRTKEETELRKAAMERKKDKEEEKAAREAVKAAIEQDRQARKVAPDLKRSLLSKLDFLFPALYSWPGVYATCSLLGALLLAPCSLLLAPR